MTSADLVVVDWAYVVWNILFLGLLLLFSFSVRMKKNKQLLGYISFVLALKYYEWVWNLLHKSMTLAIVGVCLLIVASVVQKESRFHYLSMRKMVTAFRHHHAASCFYHLCDV